MPDKVPWTDLFPSTPKKEGDSSEPKTRKPRGTGTANAAPPITKEAIATLFELGSAGLMLSGMPEYALTKQEIDSLAEAWHRVAKEYPAFGKYLVAGRKASVWGNLLFTHYIVIAAKLKAADAKAKSSAKPQQAGTARTTSGHDWVGQDDASREATSG